MVRAIRHAAERLHFTPYSVDNERLGAGRGRARARAHEAARELGIPARRRPGHSSVARLIPKKQPLALLDAFERVAADTRCTLLIVGSGSLEERFGDERADPGSRGRRIS